tara:strand:+ start:366 stop:716 length:351 start_codon:yes stop_codon:yes gene_type:complete
MAKKGNKAIKKGLGDTVAAITEATGIKKIVGDCKGCDERQQKLNKLFPYKRDLNDSERKEWELIINREDKDNLTKEQELTIVRLLKDCLNMSIKPCVNCDIASWNTWINKINNRYN